MEQYEDIRALGRGAYAQARLVRRRTDGALLVVKRFYTPLSELSAKERVAVTQEVRLLSHLRNPAVIEYFDSFVQDGVMHIVMEYAPGGTVHELLVSRRGELLPEDTVWEMFVQVRRRGEGTRRAPRAARVTRTQPRRPPPPQIVAALRFVHSCNVLHRDLKTANILRTGPEDRTLKLGDFGISKVLASQRDMASTIVGTPHYLSPEQVQGQHYDSKSDVWALGVVL